MIPELIATLASGIFSGAAAYVSFVEQPARLSCGPELALREWRPSYMRGTLMQAPLAVVGSLSALMAWWFHREPGWIIGGLLLLLVVPYTLVVLFPTNKRLESEKLVPSSEEAIVLLRRWGRLHAVRSVLSAVAFAVFTFTLMGRR